MHDLVFRLDTETKLYKWQGEIYREESRSIDCVTLKNIMTDEVVRSSLSNVGEGKQFVPTTILYR